MVDSTRLRDLLDTLGATVAELRRLRDLGGAAVRADRDRLNSLKYLFVLAGEQSIDIGRHVISSENLRAPTTFADVFVSLSEAGWITTDLAGRLGALAGFRNLLVHGYAVIDDDRVVAYLDELGDLAAFRTAIAGALIGLPGPG